mmetsp:Transcript_139516/g.242705  ORF Transcript_139516/g.242705 Transcript_139516/m.242705 type:complete len:210 (+) Transcript_139516:1125-1754(+)
MAGKGSRKVMLVSSPASTTDFCRAGAWAGRVLISNTWATPDAVANATSPKLRDCAAAMMAGRRASSAKVACATRSPGHTARTTPSRATDMTISPRVVPARAWQYMTAVISPPCTRPWLAMASPFTSLNMYKCPEVVPAQKYRPFGVRHTAVMVDSAMSRNVTFLWPVCASHRDTERPAAVRMVPVFLWYNAATTGWSAVWKNLRVASPR